MDTTEEAATEKLTDLRFTGQGLPKAVCIAGEEDSNAPWSQSKFVVCTDHGTVYQYSDGQWEMVELDEKSPLALSVKPLPPFLLPSCAKRWLTAAVCLHSSSQGLLWVCGDRRGSLLLFQEGGKQEQNMRDGKIIAESSQTGRKPTDGEGVEAEGNGSGGDIKTEMMEDRHPTLHPLSCRFGVHGKQGVTSVCEYQGLLYSTGRDGCVRVFRVNPTPPEKPEEKSVENKDGLQLQVLRVQRACKGMEWLERILILEPDIPVKRRRRKRALDLRKKAQKIREEKPGLL
ncbi:hypothetical protein F7725_000440 [Dissostichus mawsoni]|uniref:Uncharacterized protein n=1 Tax=Dissostichus mawsoni TaxID=36200 RepID=A0A7J5ZEE6_DISMA|nr:hypothetical protein F7725_000440 [Dissostichus mawsoni]